MKAIKKHKWALLLSLFILILVIIIILVNSYIFINNNDSVYGNRLNGIDEVPIKEDLKNDIINSLKTNENIKTVEIDIRGKIINIIAESVSNSDLSKIKLELDEILIKFSDDYLAFYDIQFFVFQETTEEDENIIVIGYKNNNSDIIVWDGNE